MRWIFLLVFVNYKVAELCHVMKSHLCAVLGRAIIDGCSRDLLNVFSGYIRTKRKREDRKTKKGRIRRYRVNI